jgi:WD40 repeat protein
MAWVITDSVVRGLPLSGRYPIVAPLAAVGRGTVAPLCDGVVAGFPSAAALFMVNGRGEVFQTAIRYRGVASVCAIQDRTLCAIPQSGTIHMIAPDGRDDRSFVGHCGPATGLAPMSDHLFASHGRDDTVRIWDVRQSIPVSTVLLSHASVSALSGSPRHLVIGFTHRLGVVELRKDHCTPVLGVDTPGCTALSLSYDAASDHLSLFASSDQSGLFRRSPHFLSI